MRITRMDATALLLTCAQPFPSHVKRWGEYCHARPGAQAMLLGSNIAGCRRPLGAPAPDMGSFVTPEKSVRGRSKKTHA